MSRGLINDRLRQMQEIDAPDYSPVKTKKEEKLFSLIAIFFIFLCYGVLRKDFRAARMLLRTCPCIWKILLFEKGGAYNG